MPTVSEAKADEIKTGMTREEVQDILGSPHRTLYVDDDVLWFYRFDSLGNHQLLVQFDKDFRVISSSRFSH